MPHDFKRLTHRLRHRLRPPSFLHLKHRNKKVLIKNLFLAALVIFVGGSLMILAAFAWVSRDLPDPNALSTREVEQSTKIYDRTGEHLLYEIHGNENRTLVKLEDIPDTMIWATISVEDQQFYKHSGFNPVRIFKGVVLGALFKGRVEGGSTITQQLVKNAILTNERTVVRKIKELILSLAIEQRYTKDEILQLYFNEIPYGSTNYGVEAASQSYFGKSVSDITLAEAATLASLPKAPTRYLNNPDELDARRDLVLSLMFTEGYITEEEKTAAQAEEIAIREQVNQIAAPHFVFYVKELLVEKYSERQVEQGGLKVITSLDFDKQLAAETAVKEGVEARGDAYGFENAALAALDPRTGEILAMVGSKDYFADDIDGAVNVTTRLRQPGSSFKPIVYTAGFLRGYTPNTILYDVVTAFKTETGDYTPHNYDLRERGPLTVRRALQGSLNIPAVKMLYLVGVQNVLDFAETLGYTSFDDRGRFGLALVLGGGEVKLVEHVGAFGVFAADGVLHPSVAILKVEGPDGTVFEEWKLDEGRQVVETNAARMITNVLSDNAARAYVFGSSSYLVLPDRPVAAKTGTTNDYHDAWTVGYTPSLAAGVWVGNNDNREMVRGADGSIIAAPIWNAFMRAALLDAPVEGFAAPAIPVTGKAVVDGVIPTTTFTIDKATGKLATEDTPESMREEKACAEHHSILHYVDPNNPLGPEPGEQPNNPQYVSWEAAIQSWLLRVRGLPVEDQPEGVPLDTCEMPTEYDDVHTQENEPDITILEPDGGDKIGRVIDVEINASAPRGIDRIDYAIDGRFVFSSASSRGATFELPAWVDEGDHMLRATALDDVENAASDEVSIEVTESAPTAEATIVDPLNGQTIEKIQDTYKVIVQVADPEATTSLTLFAEPLRGGTTETVGTVDSPSSPFITFTWPLPSDGEYILYARHEDADGDREDSGQILVHIVGGENENDPILDLTDAGSSDADTTEEALPAVDVVSLTP